MIQRAAETVDVVKVTKAFQLVDLLGDSSEAPATLLRTDKQIRQRASLATNIPAKRA
jgi:hypothetical protein